MASARLKASDREFFAALERVIYVNPFSDERARVIQRLVPGATSAELVLDQEALRRMVEPRLRPFADAAELQRLDAGDRGLVQNAFLYVCYHHHLPQIDELIEREIARQEAPSAERIARSVTAELAQCAIDADAAIRYFAFFYDEAGLSLHRALGHRRIGADARELRRALWDNVFTHDMLVYRDKPFWTLGGFL